MLWRSKESLSSDHALPRQKPLEVIVCPQPLREKQERVLESPTSLHVLQPKAALPQTQGRGSYGVVFPLIVPLSGEGLLWYQAHQD